jgi:hypothetical protein
VTEHNRNFGGEKALSQAMSRIAAERSVGVIRTRKRLASARVRFYAVDRSVCVLIEADSEDDARSLCQETRIEFLCLCDG